MLMQQFSVALRPYESLTQQEKNTHGSLFRTEINPGGPLVVGKPYSILAINDRSGGDWSFLIANEYGRFVWIAFDLCVHVPYVEQATLPVTEEKKAPSPKKGKEALVVAA